MKIPFAKITSLKAFELGSGLLTLHVYGESAEPADAGTGAISSINSNNKASTPADKRLIERVMGTFSFRKKLVKIFESIRQISS
ncbi:hypothetical protein [Cohnella cellulosilytica]|uniref:Uncharacterized protein n=1 Tax=Cohnella cellulosilytica TaxID=986710 RepID=A0ABW2FLW8_9BACL